MKLFNIKKEKYRNFISKFLLYFTLTLILSSITTSFFSILFNRTPNIDLINATYDEKMQSLPGVDDYNKVFVFVKNNVKKGRNVLFLEFLYYQLGKSFLYPDVYSKYHEYSDNNSLIQYLKENDITYICIVKLNFPFGTNRTFFRRLADGYPGYLLTVRRDEL